MMEKMVFGKLDLHKYREFSSKYWVTHFPTSILFHEGIDLPVTYTSERKMESLKQWIHEQMGYQIPLTD
jgi:hypothetical protein